MSKDNLPPKEPTKPHDGHRTQLVNMDRKPNTPSPKAKEPTKTSSKPDPKSKVEPTPKPSETKTTPAVSKPTDASKPTDKDVTVSPVSSKSPTKPPQTKATNTKNVSNAESLVGTLVKGRYKLEALIGHGGLCDVYRAKDKVLEYSGSESPYVA